MKYREKKAWLVATIIVIVNCGALQALKCRGDRLVKQYQELDQRVIAIEKLIYDDAEELIIKNDQK